MNVCESSLCILLRNAIMLWLYLTVSGRIIPANQVVWNGTFSMKLVREKQMPFKNVVNVKKTPFMFVFLLNRKKIRAYKVEKSHFFLN
jgi:hypothetical protein